MGWKISDIHDEKLRRKIIAASAPVASTLPAAEPQPNHGAPLDGAAPTESRSQPRTKVRISRYATRLLDADNFAGGCKYLVDALRHAGLIANDDPASVALEFGQVKVGSKEEEGTEILITEET